MVIGALHLTQPHCGCAYFLKAYGLNRPPLPFFKLIYACTLFLDVKYVSKSSKFRKRFFKISIAYVGQIDDVEGL